MGFVQVELLACPFPGQKLSSDDGENPIIFYHIKETQIFKYSLWSGFLGGFVHFFFQLKEKPGFICWAY